MNDPVQVKRTDGSVIDFPPEVYTMGESVDWLQKQGIQPEEIEEGIFKAAYKLLLTARALECVQP